MAIRFDASGDYTRRTANLPTWADWTATCWYYHVANRSAWSFVMGMENALVNATAYEIIGLSNTNLFELSTQGGATLFGTQLVSGSWNFLALRRITSGNLYAFHMTTAGVWQTVNRANNSFTPAVVWFGSNSYDEWANGRLAAIKLWDAGLADQEIYNEALTIAPRRTANLNLFCPAFPGVTESVHDYSGNGRDLIPGGTLTDEDPPPISWGAPYAFVSAVTEPPPTTPSFVPKSIARRTSHMLVR